MDVLGFLIICLVGYLLYLFYSAISSPIGSALGDVTGAAGGLFSGVLGSKVGQFGIGAVGSTIGAAGGALAGSINIGKAFTVDGILNGKIITNPSSVVKNIGGGAKKIGNSVAKPFKPIKKIKFW